MVVAFDEQLALLRAGDPAIVRQFVTDYEPFIRRAIRPRLTRTDLRRAADSADLCQSVLGSFLIHLMGGEFGIASKDELERLLLTFAQRKVSALTRREFAERRDCRRLRELSSDSHLADPQGDPADAVEDQDLLEEVSRRLSPADRELFDLRRAGLDWQKIAAQLQGSDVLLRKRLSRALNRIAVTLSEESQDG